MYKIEIFDEQVKFAAACALDDSCTIDEDYLAMTPYQLVIPTRPAQKGWYTHITDNAGHHFDGIIADVQPDQKETTTLSIRPLQALFDAEVFVAPGEIVDAGAWIESKIREWYIDNPDALQNRPVSLVPQRPRMANPIITDGPTVGLLSVMAQALTNYGILVKCELNPNAKAIDVWIYQETSAMVLEADLANVLSRAVTLGDSYGGANKAIIRQTQTDPDTGVMTVMGQKSYYLHPDGQVDSLDRERILPVFWHLEDVETSEQWEQAAAQAAKAALQPQAYDNEIELEYRTNDQIARPLERAIGSRAEIYLGGVRYNSILTGRAVSDGTVRLTFGAVRVELTKKLTMERRR